jgi:hypothetical protein
VKPSQSKRRTSIPLAMLLILNCAVFAQITKDTPDSAGTKFISVCDAPVATPNTKSPQPCKPQIPSIEIATSKQLYSAVADAITVLHDGQYGFPADIVGEACDIPYARWSFSPWPLKFRKLDLVDELQSVKKLRPTSKIGPSVVAIDLPVSGQHVYPADYVRSLFVTELFPSKVRVVESWPAKGSRKEKALYILLEKGKALEAKNSLGVLAASVSNAGPNQPESQHAGQKSSFAGPHLFRASLPRLDIQASAGNEDECPSRDLGPGIAAWLPCLTIGDYAIEMWISDNQWRCGTWTKAVSAKDTNHAINDRLKNLNFNKADEMGCVLELDIHTPAHADNVFTSVTVGGKLQGRYACSPDQFGDGDQVGVTGEPCDNGTLNWNISGDALSSEKHPVGNSLKLQIGVPYFDLTASRPKIMVGVSAEVRTTFAWKLKSSCWCSPNQCDDADQKVCASKLVR